MADANFKPRTIWTGDNLYVMRGMNSESVNLIYLDPPFNSKHDYAAPIGSAAAGAAFKDTWNLTDLDNEWIDELESKAPKLYHAILSAMTASDKSYLVYMAIRLIEMKRLLKPTGSIYLHCDPTMSHYLKILMDAVFGKERFFNEIIWAYRTGGVSKKHWPRKHDVLFFYTKEGYRHRPQQERIFYDKPFFTTRTDNVGRYYADVYIRDVWDDLKPVINVSKERTGYPTQKPLALLDRIIRSSSNPGDLVLDPFCGCATTMVAAHSLGDREWVGIDISPKAAELVVTRITDLQGSLYIDYVSREDLPLRTDLGKLPRYNCKENRALLYGRQKGNCTGCGTHFEMRHLEVDHIIARNKGGTDHLDNLQLLCGHCNRTKGDRGMTYLRKKLQLAA